ncbi:delta and Notch-like epidermal growth factor-related receptor [Pecten maximus]|uniref:delta and Notch-like epidermal growth factor-related receptor n=1 Tax=Pecten maximus TaxID=6579 RepID=UPI00145800FC|nr:delta and Notch-like epidermal growth factor-related receptor [Pecten maximus]
MTIDRTWLQIVKVNLCAHNPCRNNSACIDLGTSIRCLCRPGYTGHNCEVNINDCSSNPCLHMGTCHDSVNGYWCSCTEPHAGFNCEFTFDVFAPPMETEITEEASKSYLHNLYIVAGTLMGAICIVVAVVTTCYCRLHETYKKIRWKRLRSFEFRTPKGSLEVSSLNKPRLSTDAIMEATSLTRDLHTSSSYSETLSTRLV